MHAIICDRCKKIIGELVGPPMFDGVIVSIADGMKFVRKKDSDPRSLRSIVATFEYCPSCWSELNKLLVPFNNGRPL